MKFINNFLLYIIMLPAALYRKMGADTTQLYAILKVKLLIDNRRPFSLRSMGRQQKKEANNTSVITIFISMFMGLLFLMAFSLDGQETQMTLYFGMMIFMLASILISDFTSVLIDVRDNYIILPKPVTDRTLVLARVLHIMVHVLKVIIPMSLPGMITVGVLYGIVPVLVFILSVLLCTLFTLFLINLIYVLILKIVSPQRFKTVISFVQIILAIIVYGSYQVVPRMIERSHFGIAGHKNLWLLPPYWFAACIKSISSGTATGTELAACLLAFIFPAAALYIMIRFLAPSFNRKISSINTVADTASAANNRPVKQVKRSYSDRIARLVVKDNTEKAGFLFSWKIGNRSRDFYMKVYPAFGYLIVMLFVIFFNNKKYQGIDLSHLQYDQGIVKIATLYLVYFSGYILLAVIGQIPFSEKYKAAWMFYTTPLQAPGRIISGTFKSIIVKFYLPIVLLLSLVSIFLFGWRLLPDLFLGAANVIMVAALLFSGKKDFPFAKAANMNESSSNFMKNLFRLMLIGACGAMHYFIFSFQAVVLIWLALSCIAIWMLTDSMKKISWQSMKAAA